MGELGICSRWVTCSAWEPRKKSAEAGPQGPTWSSETNRGMAEDPKGGNSVSNQVEGYQIPEKAAEGQGIGLEKTEYPGQEILYIQRSSSHLVTKMQTCGLQDVGS
jgi:hypothetical protein